MQNRLYILTDHSLRVYSDRITRNGYTYACMIKHILRAKLGT